MVQLKDTADLLHEPHGVKRKPGKRSSTAPTSDLDAVTSANNSLRDVRRFLAKAADAIAELSRRNDDLEAAASRTIRHYKSETKIAERRTAELNASINKLERAFQSQAREFQRRFDDLQSRLSTAQSQLEKKTREHESSLEWCRYFTTEVRVHLVKAPAKAPEAHGVRASRSEPQVNSTSHDPAHAPDRD